MHKKSIYQRQCPQIAAVFNSAPSSDKVLIAALDFAKQKHVCLICNGNGQRLLKPFSVHNNREGLVYLLERIKTSCKRHAIAPGHVVIGGEDCPPYALNLLWALHQAKVGCVVRVNAWKAKQQRENVQASTDKLDLLAVAKTLINRDAYLVFDSDPDIDTQNRNYEAMRELGRTRDALVKAQTAVSNRIHNVVNVLFPGFLDPGKDNPISPFAKGCLALMERNDFCATAYARKKPEALAARLKKLGMRESADKARRLIQRAKLELPPCPQTVGVRQQCLGALIATWRNFETLSHQLETQLAASLAISPAAVLTSISGIGVISAGAIGGEQGHPERLGPLAHLCSYAGIVPGIDQTGGPDRPAKVGKVKARCNRRLKRHLVHAINHMGNLLGPPEFRADYDLLKANGQHADFVMARRFLDMAKTLTKYRTIYLPPHLRKAGMDREELFEYLQSAWPKLREKWRSYWALEVAFAPGAPLGIWRALVENTYRIELPMERNAAVNLLPIDPREHGLADMAALPTSA